MSTGMNTNVVYDCFWMKDTTRSSMNEGYNQIINEWNIPSDQWMNDTTRSWMKDTARSLMNEGYHQIINEWRIPPDHQWRIPPDHQWRIPPDHQWMKDTTRSSMNEGYHWISMWKVVNSMVSYWYLQVHTIRLNCCATVQIGSHLHQSAKPDYTTKLVYCHVHDF